MASQQDVREIANALPGVVEGEDRIGFGVLVKGKSKGLLWSWMERVDPKKPKVVNDGVIAVVVPNEMAKQMLIEADPEIYFTEDHYRNYPAVLVRLDAISIEELEPLIVEAWKCKAAPDEVRAYESTA